MHPHAGGLVHSQNRLVFPEHIQGPRFGWIRRRLLLHYDTNFRTSCDRTVGMGGFAVNKNGPLLLQPFNQRGGKRQLSP